MKYQILTTVYFKGGPLKGVIVDRVPQLISKHENPGFIYVDDPWYEVDWVDGTSGIHPESHLTKIDPEGITPNVESVAEPT